MAHNDGYSRTSRLWSSTVDSNLMDNKRFTYKVYTRLLNVIVVMGNDDMFTISEFIRNSKLVIIKRPWLKDELFSTVVRSPNTTDFMIFCVKRFAKGRNHQSSLQ